MTIYRLTILFALVCIASYALLRWWVSVDSANGRWAVGAAAVFVLMLWRVR